MSNSSTGLKFAVCLFLLPLAAEASDVPRELRAGRAGHAFDHLGNIGAQAETAAASGATIIYATGLGGVGYSGLPSQDQFAAQIRAARDYSRLAKRAGIHLVIGYVCATSIVGLESFDKNWTPAFRAQFHQSPSEWRQQGRDGKPLRSWYGGAYQPACMNNPDWLAYEKFIVRQQLETGCDGIFFDNPTVHPEGCFCEHCMNQFANWLSSTGIPVPNRSVAAIRTVAVEHKVEFMQFRCGIARDFLADIRRFARSIKRDALITCNNSLNSPEVLFEQCRSYAYNIHELSKAEDYVVVEDMGHQPRTLGNGQMLEYGPTYELIRAVSHGKPIVAVTIAEADYHTAPELVRLAMAEAAAHNASYLSWPTWPEDKRRRMVSAIRPQADWLRKQEHFLNDATPRRDAIVFMPFRRWKGTGKCWAGEIAKELSRENLQYEVIDEDEFSLARITSGLNRKPILIIESRSILSDSEAGIVKKFEAAGGNVLATGTDPHWLMHLISPSLVLTGAKTVRALVRDQSKRTIIHLLNLNIQRINSFEDHVEPARDVQVRCLVPFDHVSSCRAFTADGDATNGKTPFAVERDLVGTWVRATVPQLSISTILVIER